MDLTNVELFQDLLFIKWHSHVLDLHNYYDCTNINFDLKAGSLAIAFKKNINTQPDPTDLCVIFKGVVIVKFDVQLNDFENARTLDTFYRGRFEKDGKAVESSS